MVMTQILATRRTPPFRGPHKVGCDMCKGRGNPPWGGICVRCEGRGFTLYWLPK